MIYVIYKEGFDNYENHTPHYEDIIGYVEDYHDACAIIATFVKLDAEEEKTYIGYNSVVYPKYHFKEITKMFPNVLNVGDYRELK